MDDDRIDLRSLDPSRDPERWDRMIDSVTARALRARTPRSVPLQLLAWSRPALAMAAAMALVIWGAALASEPESVVHRTKAEPATVLASWAAEDELPTAAEILDVLGGEHGSR